MIKEKMIERARAYLEANPLDSAHSYSHHQNVAANCVWLIQGEGLNVDPINLSIAAWWHDVESREGATNLLDQEMDKLGIDKNTKKAIKDIIKSHTYGEEQLTVEAQVLFDADKMEYFNPQRMIDALEDAKKGVLPIPTLQKQYSAWMERYLKVLELFHFSSSRQFAYKNLAATKLEIDKIGRFLENFLVKN